MKQKVRRMLVISGIAVTMGASGLVLGANAASCPNSSDCKGDCGANCNQSRSYNRDDHRDKRDDCDKRDCKSCDKQKDHRDKSDHRDNYNNHERQKMATVVGKVKAVEDHYMILKRGGDKYIIRITSDSKVLGHDRTEMKLSDIKKGDQVRVFGKIDRSHKVLSAKTIFDLSR